MAKNEISEVLEIVNFIKDRMATKDDIANMATKEDIVRIEERLFSIEQELKEIKRRLSDLEKEIGGVDSKYKKDIEDLWKHVIAIEKRLKAQRA